MENDIKIFFWK